jgi:hypothetical protein
MLFTTFKQSYRNWSEYQRNKKTIVSSGLTFERAELECTRFNQNRTPEDIKQNVRMFFTTDNDFNSNN